MSSAESSAEPPVPLILHLINRRHPQLSGHDRTLALLDAAHIRVLQHVPTASVASSGLYPSVPPPPIHFSSAAHQHLLTDDAAFFATAHLSVAEFTLLHVHVQQRLSGSRNHSNSNSPHLHPMPTTLTTADQLLLWLNHCLGDRISQLSVLFSSLHRSTIFRTIDHVSRCINEALDDIISWPNSEERERLHGMMSVCRTAVAVLDGTHCPIQAPCHLSNTYFSGYKHKHTQNYLVCVNYLGMIVLVEGPYPGRDNDRKVYTSSNLYQNRADYLNDDENILADGGFIGGEGLLVPIHATSIDAVNDDRARQVLTEYNREFTANRLIVEDVFGWLKERACILNTAWERRLDKQATAFKAACRVHNFTRLVRIDHAMQLNANQAQ